MRAIMIIPKLHRVCDVELAGDEVQQLAEMRRLIGAAGLDHTRVSDLGDELWLDGRGLLAAACWAFKIRQAGPFAGTGIIIGNDRYGKARSPVVPIEMIQNDVTWLDEIEPELHYETEDFTMPDGTLGRRIAGIVTYKRVR